MGLGWGYTQGVTGHRFLAVLFDSELRGGPNISVPGTRGIEKRVDSFESRPCKVKMSNGLGETKHWFGLCNDRKCAMSL
ncbi:hypothetical protein PAXRUDRAFT_832135 [Paxillus rubicundulus Ve08.2h10]|uniref:Uncharacterized protein n=1 Tax=Paxillus rubicundulus Ve08.2h10 TaxID=930991 RepID=A0A0D0DLL8_9AGAM|nr:hypothetical protein PAXRUDRAFT_832135 [Paxillus rubicundulus Ve08.2h10]